MISASDITKSYGSQLVLSRLSLSLGDTGLVAVLGRSGCGKTTFLNIVGGLEHDFEGTLEIGEMSTASFTQKDWDGYRGHKVGFVFQDPHLVDYLNAEDNVRTALALSGKEDRDEAAAARQALAAVGLAGMEDRMPQELSGGQAQRVAVARALAKDPEIILADEPTGSLDIESSRQVMDLLSCLSKERLVVVVTHNRELAEEYADRIIELGERCIVRDVWMHHEGQKEAHQSEAGAGQADMPAQAKDVQEAAKPQEHGWRRRAQALRRLAVKHLSNKRQRAAITIAVAALGILGMCLSVAVQDGARAYMRQVSATALATSPIVIQQNGMAAAVEKTAIDDVDSAQQDTGTVPDEVTTSHIAQDVALAALQGSRKSDLQEFLWYVDSARSNIWDEAYDVQAGYDEPLDIYDADGTCIVDDGKATLLQNLSLSHVFGTEGTDALSSILPDASSLVRELPYNEHTGRSPYELLAGHMPESYDEAVIITDYSGRVSDYFLYATGIADLQQLKDVSADLLLQKSDIQIPGLNDTYSFDDLIGREFTIMPASDYYTKSSSDWTKIASGSSQMDETLANAPKLKIVGIVRESKEIKDVVETGAIGYSSELIPWLVEHCGESEIAQQQKAAPAVDVFNGKAFADEARGSRQAKEAAQIRSAIRAAVDESMLGESKVAYLESLTDEQVIALKQHFQDYFDASGNFTVSKEDVEKVAQLTDEEFRQDVEAIAPATLSSAYAENMAKLGVTDESEPTEVRIYPASIEDRSAIISELESYNKTVGGDSAPLSYEDTSQRGVDNVTKVTGVVKSALLALMVLALALSAFMMFSVTSVAAIERRQEIGTLRALGASQKDIIWLFSWENILIGLVAGILGAALAFVASIPLSQELKSLTGTSGLVSLSPGIAALALVLGIVLAVFSGLIPAIRAAKADPAKALR